MCKAKDFLKYHNFLGDKLFYDFCYCSSNEKGKVKKNFRKKHALSKTSPSRWYWGTDNDETDPLGIEIVLMFSRRKNDYSVMASKTLSCRNRINASCPSFFTKLLHFSGYFSNRHQNGFFMLFNVSILKILVRVYIG